jgi:argininosuccinate lyase
MSRFREPQHPDFVRLNTSIGFDRRLWPQDIAQSKAHAAMLAARAIISDQDRDALLRGLDEVARELEQGHFVFSDDDEDIHMAIERRLTEIVGPVGGKLHTARSRNDQVATDLAMYTREHAQAAQAAISGLMGVLVECAERHLDWPMPGYTHLQRAQPVYLSHHLLAYFWMLARDRERFAFAVRQCASLPLGAGALAGVSFDTDRELVARELGFAAPAPNSIDAVSNRDFALDYLSAASTCATHLSRLGAELVLWSSSEFGFCELPDAWSAGSSIMPQKKNPDAAELLRAKAPRVVSHLAGLYGVMHALPLTYNKDLQEDKQHLFDSCDTLALALAAAHGMVSGVSFDRERLAAAAGDELIAATDVADLLVRRGMPFREAHGIVAGLVRLALDSGRQLSELTPEELRAHSELLDIPEDGPDGARRPEGNVQRAHGKHPDEPAGGAPGGADEYYKVLERDSWLESKVSQGGTALARVREQLELARAVLADEPRS